MADRKHRVECECGDPTHFVQINYYEWGEPSFPRHTDIAVWWVGNTNFGFWKRVWVALQFVFRLQDMVVSDFVISKDSARETGQFLIGIADTAEKWEAGE